MSLDSSMWINTCWIIFIVAPLNLSQIILTFLSPLLISIDFRKFFELFLFPEECHLFFFFIGTRTLRVLSYETLSYLIFFSWLYLTLLQLGKMGVASLLSGVNVEWFSIWLSLKPVRNFSLLLDVNVNYTCPYSLHWQHNVGDTWLLDGKNERHGFLLGPMGDRSIVPSVC